MRRMIESVGPNWSPDQQQLRASENNSVAHINTLLFILATPPETSGSRTTARIEMAREVMGFPSARAVNLFPLTTKSVIDISTLGIERDPWASNRCTLMNELEDASEIVLAYGVTEPSGPAKLHHRWQVEWLKEQIVQLGIPTWTVGGRPRHPSRWQRYTSKVHPSLAFRDALRRSLQLDVVTPS